MDTLYNLPPQLNPEILANYVTTDTHFFYGKHSKLSNFHPAQIKEGPNTYCCQEQYYCYHRAKFFQDQEAMKKIMKTTDPVQMKRTTITNFDKGKWEKESERIMEYGVYLKFTQNEILGEYLKNTEGKDLVEANPSDTIWGIGMGMKSEKIQDKQNWGQNKMGKILMKIRENLRK